MRGDLEPADLVPVDLVVIAAVGVQVLGAAQWLAALAADRRDGLDQRNQLGDIVAVAAGQRRGQRDAVRLDDHVVLAANLAPVHRGRTGGRPALHRADVAGVDCGAGEVQQVCGLQFGEQQLVQALPDPGLVPVPQPSPAGHPRAEAQLLGQKLPADPGVENEQDPAQHLATIEPLTNRTSRFTQDDRQQRLNARPQLVVDLPRPGSGLPRLDWLAPPSASINEN